MNTLTIFPHLLDYVLLAPLVLRIFVSFFILSLGLDSYRKKADLTLIIYFGTVVLLILGLYTQIAVIAGVLALIIDMYRNYWSKRRNVDIPKNVYFIYGMAGVILLSLLVSGPGFLAIDLPF